MSDLGSRASDVRFRKQDAGQKSPDLRMQEATSKTSEIRTSDVRLKKDKKQGAILKKARS